MGSAINHPYIEDVADVVDVTEYIVRGPDKIILQTPLCTVYAASMKLGTSTSIPVAIKRLRYINSGDRREIERRRYELRKEVTALMCANHPNIISFRGVCRMDSDLGIVMDWAADGPLMQYLQRSPNADRLDILSQVAAGLEYLHTPIEPIKPTIIHGDLHSGNVLVASNNRIMLSDFGLCKVVPDGLSASISLRVESMPRGRVAYLAPELHQPVVSRSCSTDVFSFSILGWEMYAGCPPFADRDAGTVAILVLMSLGERPKRHEVLRDDFIDGVWSIINDCWAPDYSNRPTMRTVRKRLHDTANTPGADAVDTAPPAAIMSTVQELRPLETVHPVRRDCLPQSLSAFLPSYSSFFATSFANSIDNSPP